MHSSFTEYDTEHEIPQKKMKLPSSQEMSKAKETLLSQILFKEIEQEINVRKEDLNLIEKNIFLVRQKLTHIKQVVAADHYRQKSVKGFLQYPPHPAVKDSFIGKCPKGFEGRKSETVRTVFDKPVDFRFNIINEIEPIQKQCNENNINDFTDSKKLLDVDKLPCYIAPNIPEDNVIKPFEPRDVHSKKEIRIIVGNVSKWLAPSETIDATHKWTVYAKVAEPDLDISLFVSKVVFFLHKSYRPNDVIEIRNPPFKLTRRGWGEFPLKAQFHFKTLTDPPIDVMHHLKLDHVHTGFETFGAETSLTVWVHSPLETNSNKKNILESLKIENDSRDFKDVTVVDKIQVEQNLFINTKPRQVNDSMLNDTKKISDIFSQEFIFNDYLITDEKNENFCFEPKSCQSNSYSCEDKGCDNYNVMKEKCYDVPNLYCDKNEGLEDQSENKIKLSQCYFNDDGKDGLFTDECAIVADEIIIDSDKSFDCNKSEFEDLTKYINFNNIVGANCNDTFDYDINPKSGSNCLSESYENAINKHKGDHSEIGFSPSNTVLELDVNSSNVNKSFQNTELVSDIKEISKSTNGIISDGTSSVNFGQKLNAFVGIRGTSNKVINGEGSTLNITKSLKKKKNEKKSMIITLQKENGQIILRKEAKLLKFKGNSSPKKSSDTLVKESILSNNPSLINSKPIIVNHQVEVGTEKKFCLKLLGPKHFKSNQEVPPVSQKKTSAIMIQRTGVSVLKKAKTIDKLAACESVTNSDVIEQCPIQNTEIAINWLMKKFPLIDARSDNIGFHTKHPYCAKNRAAFLKWPFAKQRAAEWMRAKAIGSILCKIPNLEKWTTLEILDWARVRCYTPMQNGDAGYRGPTIEPSINFVYQPRISGIQEFLNKQKSLTEEEIVDITTDSPTKVDVSSSGNSVPMSISLGISNESDDVMLLGPKLEGYKQFISKCMMNAIGETPTCELLVPDLAYPAVERVLISVFSSIAEELIRRSYNASWIRHCDNPPPEIAVIDVKAAILSRKEFDFLLPHKDNKGKEQSSVISFFRRK